MVPKEKILTLSEQWDMTQVERNEGKDQWIWQ